MAHIPLEQLSEKERDGFNSPTYHLAWSLLGLDRYFEALLLTADPEHDKVDSLPWINKPS